jgi:ubiquinone/menaquinone biosynthesis C-methylase UbiE
MAEVANRLSELYEDYYDTDRDDLKRALAARDSLAHIRALSSSPLGRLLDVGAGNGSTLAEIDRAGAASEMYAVEISASGALRIAARGLRALREVKHIDGYTIPYPDKFFDTAICIHVLEHVEHERLFLRELGRVAETVFVEAPLEGGFRGRINQTFGHINYYTRMTLLNLLRTSGLEPVASQVFTSSREYEQLLYGRRNGALRNGIRRLMLRALPAAAPHLMTYVLMAQCRAGK